MVNKSLAHQEANQEEAKTTPPPPKRALAIQTPTPVRNQVPHQEATQDSQQPQKKVKTEIDLLMGKRSN